MLPAQASAEGRDLPFQVVEIGHGPNDIHLSKIDGEIRTELVESDDLAKEWIHDGAEVVGLESCCTCASWIDEYETASIW